MKSLAAGVLGGVLVLIGWILIQKHAERVRFQHELNLEIARRNIHDFFVVSTETTHEYDEAIQQVQLHKISCIRAGQVAELDHQEQRVPRNEPPGIVFPTLQEWIARCQKAAVDSFWPNPAFVKAATDAHNFLAQALKASFRATPRDSIPSFFMLVQDSTPVWVPFASNEQADDWIRQHKGNYDFIVVREKTWYDPNEHTFRESHPME